MGYRTYAYEKKQNKSGIVSGIVIGPFRFPPRLLKRGPMGWKGIWV